MTITSPWTDIEVAIRNVKTGVVRIHHDTGRIMADGSLWDYMWTDGNFSCDCNREVFFEQAVNPAIGIWDIETECGHGAFEIVSIIELSTGRLLYTETVPNANSVITANG